jgi:hypothetical protein
MESNGASEVSRTDPRCSGSPMSRPHPPPPHPSTPRTSPAYAARRSGSAAHPPRRSPKATTFRPILGFVVPRVKAVPRTAGAAVKRVPDVPECHLMAGTADCLLKVVAQDTDDFARIHRQHLARLPGVAQMHCSFALRTVFKTTALPV